MTHREMDALMGRRVAVEMVLVRSERWARHDPLRTHKVWRERPRVARGWVVGARRLNNGYSQYLGEDDGWNWVTTGTLWCVLVARNAREEPLRVPMDGYEVLP